MESEEQILKVIQELSKTKTVIFITHHLKTVKDCDCIYVMDKGCLSESGTHVELFNTGGIYHKMYQKQQELEVYGCE